MSINRWMDQDVVYTYNSTESESEVAQSCPTLCDPMDCSLPGSLIHGIFQARVLEWVAISFSNNRVLLSHKNEWNNAICSSMVGPWDYHTKWRKSERERQISHGITDMCHLNYDTDELSCGTEAGSRTQRTALRCQGSEEREGRRGRLA